MATLHPGLPELNLPSRQGGSPSVSSWLLSYPMFRDACNVRKRILSHCRRTSGFPF